MGETCFRWFLLVMATHKGDLLARGPQLDVVAHQCRRHQVGGLVRSAGKDRAAHGGNLFRMPGAVTRMTIVGERKQHDDVNSALFQRGNAGEHGLCISALEKIGDQHEMGFGGMLDLLF